jgi:acyl-coenzyme A thioesterase PaaI-like protein
MTGFDPKDKNFEARVRTSFARQAAMATLGIEITGLKPGEVELKMPYAAAYANSMVLSTRASSRLRSIQPADMPLSR